MGGPTAMAEWWWVAAMAKNGGGWSSGDGRVVVAEWRSGGDWR